MFPPSSRSRTNYLWARIDNDRTRLADIIMHEKPNIPILRTLLDMNRDHPAIRDNLASLDAYLKLARDNHGDIKTVYKQKDFSAYISGGYSGSTYLGRSYPGPTATFLPKIVVNTLWKESHVEVDLVSSYPTMLVSCFRDLDLPTLQAYVDNPEITINDFSRAYGIQRSDIKKVVNSMICAFPKVPADLGIGFSNEDKLRDIISSSFYRGIITDLQSISGFVERHHKPFLDMITKKCESSGNAAKMDHVMGSALAHLCGDAENVVMRCIIGFLSDNDQTNTMLNDCIWKFDGIIIPREMADPGLTSRIERRVLEKTGISVTVAIRGLEGSIAISVPPEELQAMSQYEVWKTNFEKTYVAMVRPAGYCRIWPDGSLQDLKKQDFDLLTQAEDGDMMKHWRNDPDKKTYLGRDFAPEPLFIGEGYYNLWRGMKASKFPANDGPVDLAPYMYHVALLMGGESEENQPAIDYMHKLLAYKFQRPGDIWRIMVFIRSVQGVGKDIWLDFLFSLIGHQYGTRLMKVAEIAGQYNSAIEGKLLVGFSEMDAKDCHENMDSLKDMITSTRVTIKKKYVSSYDVNNSACFIGFSNNYNAIKITADDRRMFSVTASGIHANKPEYHDPLIAYLGREDVKRAVYDYYMGLDITDFNPSGDRPVTETMRELTMDSLSIGDVFLKTHLRLWIQQARAGHDPNVKMMHEDTVVRLTTRTVYDHFTVLAGDFKYKDTDSKRKMDSLCKRMLEEASGRIEIYFTRFVNTGDVKAPITSARSNGTKMYKFHIESIEKYIQEKLGGFDEGN